MLEPKEIVRAVDSLMKTGLVVITGGEPFRQDIRHLVSMLLDCGYHIQIETNGTLPAPIELPYSRHPLQKTGVYVICSPKTGSVHPTIESVACAYKYVLESGSVIFEDGLPATALQHPVNGMVARPRQRMMPIYVQPMDSKDPEVNKKNERAAVASCMSHGYILQLQLHKILGME